MLPLWLPAALRLRLTAYSAAIESEAHDSNPVGIVDYLVLEELIDEHGEPGVGELLDGVLFSIYGAIGLIAALATPKTFGAERRAPIKPADGPSGAVEPAEQS